VKKQSIDKEKGPLTHKEILVVLSGLMTGLLLAALDQTIVSTALKNIVSVHEELFQPSHEKTYRIYSRISRIEKI